MTNRAVFNRLITAGRTLPWLQDTVAQDARGRWNAVHRDVHVLDGQNRRVAVFNLTEHDLGVTSNYATLKQLFLEAARLTDADGDGLSDDWELRHFGNLAAGPSNDADADGRDNFTEYAFCTDPNDPASRTSFTSTFVQDGSDRIFSVTYRRLAGSSLDYEIETSEDLSSWSPAPATMTESFRNLFDGTGAGSSTCKLGNGLQESQRTFLRVRAVPRNQP